MPIVKQTPTILEFRETNPTGFPLVLGFVFLMHLAYLLPVLGMDNVKTLKCNRLEPTQVDCEFISSGLTGTHINPSSVNIRKAEVEEGDSITKVILVTKDGKIPLDLTDRTYEVADQINAFISNQQQQSLIIKQDDRSFIYLWIGIYIFLGIILCRVFCINIIMGPNSVTLDKNSKKMYFRVKKRKKIILCGWDLREYWLHEIKKFKAIKETDSDSNRIYKSSLLFLHSGKEVTLLPMSQEEVQSINQFLGIEL